MNSVLTASYTKENSSFGSLKTKLDNVISTQIDSYLLSATYYQLTGRKGTYIYQDESSFLIVSNHPHLENCLMIFPEVISNSDFSLTAKVLLDNYNSKHQILLCRYTNEEYIKLCTSLSNLKENSIELERVDEEIMDWKYPVRILSTEVVSKLEGGKFRKIRNKLLRAGIGIDIVPIEQCSQMNLMRAALKFWEGNMILNQKDTEDMSEFYYELFKLMENGMELINGLCFIKEGRPVGFTAWDITAGTANLYVNLADTTITGASDFQLVSTCKYLYEHNIQLLNMGGSELYNLDQFKEKYRPVITHPISTYTIKG
ncbi:hypothetical protein JNUCC31_17950 [Paenibacillus sp. JNUCC31]|uniref:phosphatidylglycerol lysyltransferase domain-containing protein n=1 Tax=Paenibacillus sp. JNUCC-31 TaxID=2777983 RepID=UPI00177AB77D|nr:phosphatidylglycerol lysyltransferase domain-containing protein [Paenibacillus sp. JNUCC-31]QOS76725.1 hypothetical protein JNUCC31_17950 [Paenibacillus sp. JNUCC-31]